MLGRERLPDVEACAATGMDAGGTEAFPVFKGQSEELHRDKGYNWSPTIRLRLSGEPSVTHTGAAKKSKLSWMVWDVGILQGAVSTRLGGTGCVRGTCHPHGTLTRPIESISILLTGDYPCHLSMLCVF